MHRKFFLVFLLETCSMQATMWDWIHLPQKIVRLFSTYIWHSDTHDIWGGEDGQELCERSRRRPSPSSEDVADAYNQMIARLMTVFKNFDLAHQYVLWDEISDLVSERETNLKNLPMTINRLQRLYGHLELLIQRTAHDFSDELDSRYRTQFEKINLEPKDVYPRLSFTGECPASIDLSDVQRQLQDRLEHTEDEAELSSLLHISFLFRNQLTKEEFDSYLAGPEAVQSLSLSYELFGPLHDSLITVCDCKDVLIHALS